MREQNALRLHALLLFGVFLPCLLCFSAVGALTAYGCYCLLLRVYCVSNTLLS